MGMERESDIMESISLNSLHPHETTEKQNKTKKTEKEKKRWSQTLPTPIWQES